MPVQPYLFFDGRCDEALAFYRKALGAEVTARMSYRQSPQPCPEGMLPPGNDDKVMHAEFRVGDAVLFASDGRCGGKPKFEGFSLSLVARSDADAARLFHALADGGTVRMPLGKTFFASSFGMVVDRFGVPWMVIAGARHDVP